MYPFGHLPGNLAAFCSELRRAHGFHIGPGELRDAARALEVVDVADQTRVRHALRAVLSDSLDTAQAFDAAFDRFFYPGPLGVPQLGMPGLEDRQQPPPPANAATEIAAPRTPRRILGDAQVPPPEDGDASASGVPVASDDGRDADEETARLARARYSALEGQGDHVLTLRPADRAWQAGARALLRRLQLGLSRRWRPARRGRRFDLRRTWRASLQTGGEALTARWLRRAVRSPRVVILVDGSRSMPAAAHVAALDLAVAVAALTSRLEVFVFSTTLRRVTPEVRRAAAGQATDVRLSGDTWGGGTDIGASFSAFLQRHGERLVSRDTLVIVVSDGLDVGEPSRLRTAMRELHRRAAGIAWLNPLADTPGYEPTSRGMAEALPFVSTFAAVPGISTLSRLARAVRVR